MAVQYVRGTRWRRGYLELTDQLADMRGSHPAFAQPLSDEEFESALGHLRGATWRNAQMWLLARKLAMAIASMRWSLLRFHAPLLATSDHPVVFWPARERSLTPQPTSVAVMDALEARMPLTPRYALVLTWVDEPDEPSPLEGTRDQARNLNAFTIAQADRQWFRHPAAPLPPRTAGALAPLSPALWPAYTARSCRGTERHERAFTILDWHREDPLDATDLDVVEITSSTG